MLLIFWAKYKIVSWSLVEIEIENETEQSSPEQQSLQSNSKLLLDKIPGGFFLLYWDAQFCSFLELLQNCRRRSDNNNNKMKKKTNKYDRGLGATVQSSCRSYRQKGQPKNIFILIFSVFFSSFVRVVFVVFSVF